MSQWLVRDVMTRDVLAVTPRTPYRKIVDLLVEHRVTAAPVVDDAGHVVGVVSEADLLYKVEFGGAEQDRRTFEPRARRVARDKAHAAVAADLMTAPAITVTPEVPVAAAARLMDASRVKRLPVVGPDGRLAGIVARRDLLRMHVRPDPDIREDIVTDVLRRALWIDPDSLHVRVTDGVVTIDGRVERRSTAGLVLRLTADVPGVVSVVDGLTWDYDDTDLVRAKGYAFGTSDQMLHTPAI